MINETSMKHKLQKSTYLNRINKAAQVAGALYHRSSMKSTSRLTQRFQGNDASFIKEKLLQNKVFSDF